MDGNGATGDFERIVGLSEAEAEARWLASLGHGTPPARRGRRGEVAGGLNL